MKDSRTFPRHFVTVAIIAASLSGRAWGLDPARAVGQFVRKHWGPEDGVPAQRVDAITQTEDGYLWIGTDAGLLRFDGFNFVQVFDRSATAFPIDHISGLAADKQGNLWVKLSSPTLLRYHDGRFTALTPGTRNEDSRVTAMSRTTDGRLLLASRRDGAALWDGSKFHTILDSPSIPHSPVISISESTSGDVWLGTQDAGLARISKHQIYTVTKGLPDLKINCLLSGKNGAMLVGTDRGMVRWNGSEMTEAGVPDALKRLQILTMIGDRDSNLWIGTGNRGLFRLNDYGLSSLNKSDHAPAVTALFEDREGDVWVGSRNGIEQLRENAFSSYPSGTGLAAENDGPIFSEPHQGKAQGRIWWAPARGGLYWLSGRTLGHITEAGLDRDVIYSIAGGGGDLWLGRQRGGLTHLCLQCRSLDARTYTKNDGLGENSVDAVYRNRDGSVWAGTLTAGASHFHDGRFDRYTEKNGLSANMIRSIVEGVDGTMWFATPRGLSSFRGGQWRTYGVAQGLLSQNVYCLFVSSTGVLWVGTQQGICFFHAGHFEVSAGLPGSLRKPVFGIVEDELRSLWIVTSTGVQRVAYEKMLHGLLKDGDVREYGLTDGLQSMAGVPRDRSSVRDEAGRIWLSRKSGLAMIDPARLGTSVPTITHIDHLRVDGTSIDLRRPLFVPPDRKRVEIGYTGLNLSAPERIRFRYRLDGFDRAWNAPVSGKDAVYTNLSPGSYSFHVAASNIDGLWNGPEAVMQFRVDPSLWQTSSFRLGAVLLIAAGILAGYRWRVHELTVRVNLRFDERLAERTRLARELHDTLLQTIEGSKLVADNALDTEVDGFEAHRTLIALEKVSAWLGNATNEARAALNSLRTPVSQEDDLVEAFQRVAEDCMQQPNLVRMNLSVEGTAIELHPIVQDEIFRIGHEAVRNACAHSGGNRIEMELSYSNSLTLRVRDNGRGISPEIAEEGRKNHFGLRGMKERAEQVGGKLSLFSAEGSGTEIELVVPGSIAYRGRRRGLIEALRRLRVAERRSTRLP